MVKFSMGGFSWGLLSVSGPSFLSGPGREMLRATVELFRSECEEERIMKALLPEEASNSSGVVVMAQVFSGCFNHPQKKYLVCPAAAKELNFHHKDRRYRSLALLATPKYCSASQNFPCPRDYY
jgi:tRNA U38,U39,U40 pseudouridine synthase TruA